MFLWFCDYYFTEFCVFELLLSSVMASRSKRNYLTLKKKAEVIMASEKNRGMRKRELTQRFECSKTQIANILKSKESILSTVCIHLTRQALGFLLLGHVTGNATMVMSTNHCTNGALLLVVRVHINRKREESIERERFLFPFFT